MTKTLVIHPKDPSTTFLEAIYLNKGYTVLNRYAGDILPIIAEHDRIIMLGHGSPSGLFSVGQFSGTYVVGSGTVPFLQGKDNVYIWCYASSFMRQHQLQGFSSGMFISEVDEAAMFGIRATQAQINHSNQLFANLVGKHLESPNLLAAVKRGYQSASCPVIAYNQELLRSIPVIPLRTRAS
jgi:hypothetical protein